MDKTTGDVCWRVGLCKEERAWSSPVLRQSPQEQDKSEDSSKLTLSDDMLFSPVTPEVEDDVCEGLSLSSKAISEAQECGSGNKLSVAAELVKLHMEQSGTRSRV